MDGLDTLEIGARGLLEPLPRLGVSPLFMGGLGLAVASVEVRLSLSLSLSLCSMRRGHDEEEGQQGHGPGDEDSEVTMAGHDYFAPFGQWACQTTPASSRWSALTRKRERQSGSARGVSILAQRLP